MAQVVTTVYVDDAAQKDESSMYTMDRVYKAERQKASNIRSCRSVN